MGQLEIVGQYKSYEKWPPYNHYVVISLSIFRPIAPKGLRVQVMSVNSSSAHPPPPPPTLKHEPGISYPGCQRLFILRDWERDLRRSREEKNNLWSHIPRTSFPCSKTYQISHQTGSHLRGRHSICLFSFWTFRLSIFARGATIREIARAKGRVNSLCENYSPMSRQFLSDLQLEFTDM